MIAGKDRRRVMSGMERTADNNVRDMHKIVRKETGRRRVGRVSGDLAAEDIGGHKRTIEMQLFTKRQDC
jgi:hypothetical protein